MGGSNMLGATHLLVGASISVTLRSNSDIKHNQSAHYKLYFGLFSLFIYTLAFLSHFLLDSIPHYELSIVWNFVLGAVSGLLIAYMTIKRKNLRILVLGFLAGLPDLIWLLGFWPSFDRIHNYFHFKSSVAMPGYFIMVEIILSVLAIWILMKRS
jgi:hypothetical protein